MKGKAFVVMDDVEKEAQYHLRVDDSLGVTTLGHLLPMAGSQQSSLKEEVDQLHHHPMSPSP